MPRVELMSPDGFTFTICTRNAATLRAWFDEVLPWTHIDGRPGVDDFGTLWPRVNVWPMWAWQVGRSADPDWLTDSRVLGRLIELPAKDGASGIAAMADIRRTLEAELRTLEAQ